MRRGERGVHHRLRHHLADALDRLAGLPLAHRHVAGRLGGLDRPGDSRLGDAGGRGLDVVAGDRAVRAGRGQRARGRRRGPWRACGPAAWPAPGSPADSRRWAAGVAGTAVSSASTTSEDSRAAGHERALHLQLGGRTGVGRRRAPPRRGRRFAGSRAGRSRPGSGSRRLRSPPGWTCRSPSPARPGPARGRLRSRGLRAVADRMIGVPTATVSPSGTRSAVIVPAYGDGSSTSDLAVSISTTMSLTLMTSPTFTFQVTISASVRPSPTSGSLYSFTSISWCASVGERAVDGVEHPVEVGEPLLLDAARAGTACRSRPRAAPAPRGSRSTPR